MQIPIGTLKDLQYLTTDYGIPLPTEQPLLGCGGVYIITAKGTRGIYVGMTTSFTERRDQHSTKPSDVVCRLRRYVGNVNILFIPVLTLTCRKDARIAEIGLIKECVECGSILLFNKQLSQEISQHYEKRGLWYYVKPNKRTANCSTNLQTSSNRREEQQRIATAFNNIHRECNPSRINCLWGYSITIPKPLPILCIRRPYLTYRTKRNGTLVI